MIPGCRRWFLRPAIISFIAVLLSSPVMANLVDGWTDGYYDAVIGPLPGQETWAAYYVTHGQIRNGPQKRLTNGVKWQLATDRRTGIAAPRVVWMPDNTNPVAANRMLEMVHGGAMLFSEQQQKGFYERLRRREEDGPRWAGQSEKEHKQRFKTVREFTPKRIVTQKDVALTYASPRFVSMIDLGFIYTYEGTYTPRIIRGLTLDLQQRQIVTMETCPEGDFRRRDAIFNPTFRFAGLLEICDEASLERFEAAVQAAEDRVKAATAESKDSSIERCRGTSIDEGQQFVVYLAEGGLAVHLTQFWIRNGTLWSDSNTQDCTLRLSGRNPLIVPYRALEPLMKPGALREELLKTK